MKPANEGVLVSRPVSKMRPWYRGMTRAALGLAEGMRAVYQQRRPAPCSSSERFNGFSQHSSAPRMLLRFNSASPCGNPKSPVIKSFASGGPIR
jgi:hypothetical protein